MTVEKNSKLQLIPKDRDFFEGLYRDYYSPLVQFAEGILYDDEEARDVVQEMFLDLWNKQGAIRIESTIKTYLFSCVKYKAFNRIKKLNLIDKHQEQVKEAYLFALEYDGLTDEDLKERIRQILSDFPPQMRRVLEYHSFYGWKYHEIAEELEISVNSVKTHVKRAYKKFREEMGQELLPIVMVWYLVDKFFF